MECGGQSAGKTGGGDPVEIPGRKNLERDGRSLKYIVSDGGAV